MHKLFVNLSGALLMAAPFLLAQGPLAPSQAPPASAHAPAAGPDAVPANLVNTVCTSCHNLDRVRNKTGDRDAWTATITRMKDKGGAAAALTDQQVPLLSEYLTRAASTLPVPAGGGGRAGGRGGRGGPPTPFSAGGAAVVSAKNLKVLTAQNVEITMQNITFALGLRCIDCHEMNDLALDTKPLKLKALAMLEMTRDINAKLGDGSSPKVTCWTCHRGSTAPQTSRPISQ